MVHSPTTILPKVGPAVAKNLEKLSILTIKDLLWHFPLRYLDFRETVPISNIKLGQAVTIQGQVKSISASFAFRGRLSRSEAVISDKTGSIKVIWFNQPYIAKNISAGDKIALAGTAAYYKNVLQLQNPIYEKLSSDSVHTGRLVPVYSGSSVISNRTLRNLISTALPYADQENEILPSALLKKYGFPGISQAIKQLHFPENDIDLEKAKNRIAFEELFIHQLAAGIQQTRQAKVSAPPIALQTEQIAGTIKELPFQLTASQKRALWDIMQDIASGEQMVRLLQGDVGSGKTLVAVLASLNAAISGWQTGIIAPTEILASQHYSYFKKYLPECTIGLLTRTFAESSDGSAITKQELLEKVSTGEIQMLVGTHAILQKEVSFNKLGLVIIDEQHRFGVSQRSFMLKQEQYNRLSPHLLSMSATPIPRTLALSFYGSLKISTLTTLPTGTKKISTQLAKDTDRSKIYSQIKKVVSEGQQAFIVTPRVEDSETSDIKSVKEEYEKLKSEVFQNIPIGLLYGSMKGAEKEKVMTEFSAGKIKILVATSVIEIGIDIPNASWIVIEGAERFGLAQLHQLRGRVGRAGQKSFCVLFTTTEDSQNNERLKFFSTCLDGFALAEKDLRQRGFGNLFGTEQSGFSFQFSRFFTSEMAKIAQSAAAELFKKDKNLKRFPLLLKKIEPLLSDTHQE